MKKEPKFPKSKFKIKREVPGRISPYKIIDPMGLDHICGFISKQAARVECDKINSLFQMKGNNA